jgi:hypothetical protein
MGMGVSLVLEKTSTFFELSSFSDHFQATKMMLGLLILRSSEPGRSQLDVPLQYIAFKQELMEDMVHGSWMG